MTKINKPLFARPDLESEAREIHNHLVITPACTIERVIGYAEDDMDCYLIMKNMLGKTHWSTCVCWCDDLKPCLSKTDYEKWDECFSYNNCPHTDTFEVVIE